MMGKIEQTPREMVEMVLVTPWSISRVHVKINKYFRT